MKIKFFWVLVILAFPYSYSQNFNVSTDIRPRFEYRHGFGNLFPDDAEPGAGVIQRSRLNLDYGTEKLKITLKLQDVSVWGDTPQLSATDGNHSFSIFEAWAELFFHENWSVKAGRQAIAYDNERILGEVDWAMQGRSHDAALLRYTKNRWKADFGFAFNQENLAAEGTAYSPTAFFSYKTMQYAYLHRDWNKLSGSFLFLNNGFQKFDEKENPDGVFYRHTAGTYLQLSFGKAKITGSAYYQFGKADPTRDLSAYLLSLEGLYKTGKVSLGLGLEILSGTGQDSDGDNRSFFPLYGTNHKFNGFMDYFYVGNHANSTGLNDYFGKVNFVLGKKSVLQLQGHYFSSNAALFDDSGNEADRYLGTEIDLVYSKNLIKSVKLAAGYSHMFAADGMGYLKGRTPDNTNHWAWVMLIVKPELFSHTF
ncbi:alginate export family protein [Sinomicrobium weinanense]|uniref:Alginate export family protein n=1 Tax=Sinomicrobium weinanense TaxID=2842200 RepID=A0A926JQM1_9FLAO|nr:alginate export family protein [Sinomicrobium weinanense]MBC9795524.1 alginate export family protein [Sinomicrobium weinanense]MBU3123329.1 alginate export family protein [Sinomicrobium weinanense]